MATRQYIGARYVPKFYQNSNDGSTQWQANVVYEPLTYVTLVNGHLYLSKKQVPATIGTPAENIDYWLDVGSYNGYIEDLQNQIDAINNVTIPAVENEIGGVESKIGALNNLKTPVKSDLVNAINSMGVKSVICVSDSYGTYPSTNNNWMTKVRDYLGLDSSHFKSRAYSGAGFSTGGETFQQQLANVASGMSDDEKAAVTDVVIGGGFNDAQNNNPTMLKNDAQSCLTYIKSTFPNAKAHVAFIGWSFNSEWVSRIRQYNCIETYQNLVKIGYNYVKGSETCLRGKSAFTEESQGDTVLYLGHFYGHPSDEGASTIAVCICNHVNGYSGFKKNTPAYYLVAPTLASGLSILSGSAAFYMEQQGNVISVIKDEGLNSTVIGFTGTKDMSTGATIEIGTMSSGFIAGIDSAQSSSRPLSQMTFTGAAWQDGWKTVQGSLFFMNNKLYARIYAPDVTAAESLAIHCASGTFPANAC